MLLSCQQMQDTEERAFASGIQAADLMETAGCGIAAAVRDLFPAPGTLLLYLGSGNNAGDALVAGRELQKHGWEVLARFGGDPEKLKPLPLAHWQGLSCVPRLEQTPAACRLKKPVVCLDGLVGIGSQGPLRPHLQILADEMNALRYSHGAQTVTMDLPSGLDADTGKPQEGCVVADVTLTVGFAKAGLVADEAINHVGRLGLIPLPALGPFAPAGDDAQLVTPEWVRANRPLRPFDFHKGRAGRLGILAGSRGFYGAAEMVCRAALRAGAGLVTLLAKEDAAGVLALRVPPEIMVRTVRNFREVLDLPMDALAIGPGLGFEHEEEILEVIEKAVVPITVDADAITSLSRHPLVLARAAGPRLLTPHPGEMARIQPAEGRSRREQAEVWARENPGHTLLLKGARTVMATDGQATLFNTTGHPGMATGGMGDVLTGVTGAFLGQGYPLHAAAGTGAWLCGRAAEIHAQDNAAESTLPSDVICLLGKAWAGI